MYKYDIDLRIAIPPLVKLLHQLSQVSSNGPMLNVTRLSLCFLLFLFFLVVSVKLPLTLSVVAVAEPIRLVLAISSVAFLLASFLAGIASVHHGKQIHAHLIRTKLDGDVGIDNALVNIIIAGFGNHGHKAKALELFEQMKELGLKPDSITFIALLTTCNHVGLVDEGQAYFNSMNEINGIAPDIEHFSCLIDLLGRAGRLKEVVEYMENFPFGHDPVVLVSSLSACRLNGVVLIGEHLARKLLKRELVTTSPYALSSNLYASDGM
ncbi:hypothetical protein ACSBR2_037480 [Camellia fascicularis]